MTENRRLNTSLTIQKPRVTRVLDPGILIMLIATVLEGFGLR